MTIIFIVFCYYLMFKFVKSIIVGAIKPSPRKKAMEQALNSTVTDFFTGSGSSSSASQGSPFFTPYTDAQMRQRWQNENDARRHEYYARGAKNAYAREVELSRARNCRNKNR